ncbi:MAG: VanZ family protein [Planctomycetota bacterium]|nr:VanZ family protein [Planctomycetota bacterium]
MRETPSGPIAEAPANPGRIYLILLAIYFGLVVYGSLVPLEFRYVSFEQAIRKFREIPYFHVGIQSRSDLVANFLLFVPLTFLAMGALTRENRRRAKLLIALSIAVTTALLSAAVEFAQIYFPARTVSQNDIIAETVGGITGIVLWFCFGWRITQWARSLWTERAKDRLGVKILTGYVVLLIIYQMLPLDMTISLTELYHKWKASKVNIFPFRDPGGLDTYTILSKIAVMIPTGYLLMLLQHRRRYRIFRVVVQTCALSALIEAAQLFVLTRYSSSTDVVLGAFGGLLGAVAAMLFGPSAGRPVLETDFWRRRGIWIKLIATIALLGGMMWEKWYPFDFSWPAEGLAAGVAEILAVPFARQYLMPEFLAVGQVVREFTSFFVLGMLFRSLSNPAGKAGKIGCALPISGLAVAFEFAQVFLPSRTADPTAMVISGTGGIMGVWLFDRFVNVFLKTDQSDMNKAHIREQ